MTGWLEKCDKCLSADSEFLTILLLTEKVMKNQILSRDQIASICGVSLNLVRIWIEKKG
jgi:hypothetical protein